MPGVKVAAIVGTRPNLVKTAPVIAQLQRRSGEFDSVLVHTGQHYDQPMSGVFVDELGLPEPDHFLAIGPGSHSQHVARVMERLEPVLEEAAPDVVLVAGDVDSTLAGALTAATMQIPVAHVESGLRSFDWTMPEELNRVLTDAVAELLFTHSPEARDNLLAEGRPAAAIHDVGNTMIDSLVAMRPRIDEVDAPAAHGVEPGSYLLVTLHRPALVDGGLLAEALAGLEEVARELSVVFPVHPRTAASMERQGLRAPAGVRQIGPLGYVEFLSLLAGAAATLTDSGGIQEEAAFLAVPCFTLRDSTERPVTVTSGGNTLLGLRPDRISEIPRLLADANGRPAAVPPLWDGRAGERIADALAQRVERSRTVSQRSRA